MPTTRATELAQMGSLVTANPSTSTVTVGGTLSATTLNPNNTGFRNRIINGDMRIDQRNAGASVTPALLGYTVDRMRYESTQSSKCSVQQNAGSITPPSGFTNYLGVTSLSSYSVLTGDTFFIAHPIEGFNVADIGFGTNSAKTVTLSFWVHSSLTGSFGGSLSNGAGNRSYPYTYSISSSNTWEYKTITIAGDTSGTWFKNNGVGISVNFNLGSGSTYSGTSGAWAGGVVYIAPTGATSVVGTNGATFYITGVQLEAGSTATEFERRPYGTELALCQRYYQILQNAGGIRAETTTYLNVPFRTLCPMRSAPSGTIVGTIMVRDLSVGTSRTATTPGSLSLNPANNTGGYLEFGASSWSPENFTVGNLGALACSTGINGIALSSEL